MKVLIIGPFPDPIDGCSNSNRVFYNNLKKRNIPSDFINTNTPYITAEQGRTFSLKKTFSFLNNYRQSKKIKGSDVVYFTPGQTFYGVMKYVPFMWLCLRYGKPYTIHVHGNFLGKNYRSMTGIRKRWLHYFLSRASAGIVLTKSLKRNFEDLLPDEKVYPVPLFVEDFLYDVKPKAKKTDKLRILYLSNLMKEKGILQCLHALLTLKQKGIPFAAVIAGKIESGLDVEVTNALRELGSDVTYTGVITGNDKIKALQDANVFILPTFYPMEGLPMSLLEAMATGNIVITTRHAGIPDVVNEKNGYLVPPQSSEAITECLEIIYQNLAEQVPYLSAYNISYAASVFTEEKFTDKILSVLVTTLKKGKDLKSMNKID